MLLKYFGVFVGLFLAANMSSAQESDKTDLAKQLANPVAALISVPIQMNYDPK